MSALLEIVDVVKRFRGLTAIDSVSLSVQDGEIFAIIGPNGA
ncbi:MAG: ABC transporter ATP-binding protein, partial [Methylobacteriaceae bacterium]|nr:ABC transporter ATP-binding protein [Methylobacteriaceae bacterium]